MTSPNKLDANKVNALKSTGPKSAEGKTRSARNSLLHGLYTQAVVPAAGEDPQVFAELCQAVRDRLDPHGAIEGRLSDRVALILWRLDRVTRYDAAVATRAIYGTELPRDPDTITGEEIDAGVSMHPAARPATRLAYARARIRDWPAARESHRSVLTVLESGAPGAQLPYYHLHYIRRFVLPITQLSFKQWWDLSSLGPPLFNPDGAWQVRELISVLVREAGKSPDEVLPELQRQLVESIADYDKSIAEKVAEAEALVTQMRQTREAAQAMTLLFDQDALERVIRLEAHLMRQLTTTLDLLEQLRGQRSEEGERGSLVRQITEGIPLGLPVGSLGSFRNGEVGSNGVELATLNLGD